MITSEFKWRTGWATTNKSVIDKIVDTVKDAISAVTDVPPPSASGRITPTYGDLFIADAMVGTEPMVLPKKQIKKTARKTVNKKAVKKAPAKKSKRKPENYQSSLAITSASLQSAA